MCAREDIYVTYVLYAHLYRWLYVPLCTHEKSQRTVLMSFSITLYLCVVVWLVGLSHFMLLYFILFFEREREDFSLKCLPFGC